MIQPDQSGTWYEVKKLYIRVASRFTECFILLENTQLDGVIPVPSFPGNKNLTVAVRKQVSTFSVPVQYSYFCALFPLFYPGLNNHIELKNTFD